MRKIPVLFILFLLLNPVAIPGASSKPFAALTASRVPSAPKSFINIAFILKNQVSFDDIYPVVSPLPRAERRRLVIAALKNTAASSQSEILPDLQQLQLRGLVKSIHSLWITNSVTVEMRADALASFTARHPEIERVIRTNVFPSPMGNRFSATGRSLDQVNDISWNIAAIGVPAVWDLGYRGQNVLIANLDTGVDYTHPDLADQIWINPGEDLNGNGVVDPSDWNDVDDDNNGYIDDLRGWAFDVNSPEVMDNLGTGTCAAGVVIGNGAEGTVTGVAPEAEMMILKNYSGGEAGFWEAQQYALQMGADLITSGLTYRWHFVPKPDYAGFRHNARMLLAAGVIQVNSGGNEGDNLGLDPLPFNIPAPADCPPPWLHPDQTLIGGISAVIAVGAYNDEYQLETYSGLGPSAWFLDDILFLDPTYPYQASWPELFNDYPYQNGQEQGLIKPDLTAPTNVIATAQGGGYVSEFSGTEAAAPHVAGTLCLMLSADPDADPEALAQAIMVSAEDMGIPGKDNAWGCGRLNAFDAVAEILLETSGSLTGWVSDSVTGAPIAEAMVTLLDNGMHISTDSSGQYLLPGIPEGSYEVRFTAAGYDTLINRETRIQIGEITTLNALLQDTSLGINDPLAGSFPNALILEKPYPNPGNGVMVFHYQLPRAGVMQLTIYNLAGRKTAVLVDGWEASGNHSAVFDAAHVPSGIYLYRWQMGKYRGNGKVVVLK